MCSVCYIPVVKSDTLSSILTIDSTPDGKLIVSHPDGYQVFDTKYITDVYEYMYHDHITYCKITLKQLVTKYCSRIRGLSLTESNAIVTNEWHGSNVRSKKYDLTGNVSKSYASYNFENFRTIFDIFDTDLMTLHVGDPRWFSVKRNTVNHDLAVALVRYTQLYIIHKNGQILYKTDVPNIITGTEYSVDGKIEGKYYKFHDVCFAKNGNIVTSYTLTTITSEIFMGRKEYLTSYSNGYIIYSDDLSKILYKYQCYSSEKFNMCRARITSHENKIYMYPNCSDRNIYVYTNKLLIN